MVKNDTPGSSGEWMTTEESSRVVTPEPTEAGSDWVAGGPRVLDQVATAVSPAEEIYGPINDEPHDSPPHTLMLQDIASAVKEDLSSKFTQTEKDASREAAASLIKDDGDGMVQRWISEIDALPTFAGLFAAALTAFYVEAYKLLQVPQVDPTPEILKRISLQLGSLSVEGSSFINSTQPPYEADAGASAVSFRPPVFAIVLNILWFISLVLSLASGTIGILVKQWLREYLSGLSGDTPAIARRRQYRLNSLIYWNVAFVVAALPVLLHVAFILFLAGLLVFLHSLHPIVTWVVSIPVGIILIFMCVTAVAPSLRDDCCLYSPQSHAIFWFREKAKWLGMGILSSILLLMVALYQFLTTPSSTAGIIGQWKRVQDALRSATILTDLFTFYPSIWKNAELRCIEDDDSASRLDGDMIFTAYSTSSDVNVFDMAERYMIPGVQDERPLVTFVSRAFEVTVRQWGDQWPRKILYRYYSLVNRVVQLSLASSSEFYWHQWKPRGWDVNTLFPGRLLRVLARRETGRRLLAHRFDGPPGAVMSLLRSSPISQPYRLVLASIDRAESALIQQTLQCTAILSMHPPDTYDPWDDLVWGVDRYLEVVDWPTYQIVAAAASARFDSAMGLALGYTGGRRQVSDADAAKFIASIHALRLYLHCLTPITSSRPRDLAPISTHASQMLSKFRGHLLMSPLWDKLCRDRARDILPCYDQLINELIGLTKATTITLGVVEGLEHGLQCIEGAIDQDILATEAFRDILTVASVKDSLDILRHNIANAG